MYKRGQVSVFVILGIVLIAGIVLFFSFRDSGFEKVDIEVRPIYNFLENCIEKEAEDGVVYLADTGGHYNLPEKSHLGIPYYFYESQNLIPSKEFIESQLAKYVQVGLPHCAFDLREFKDFNIEGGEISSNVKIERDKVVFEVNFPISITKDDKTYNFENFEVKIPARMGMIHDAISEYMVEQEGDPVNVCLSCLYDLGIKYDLDTNILESGTDGVLMFIFSDSVNKINNENYQYYFMVQLEDGE